MEQGRPWQDLTMAYDMELAERIRFILGSHPAVTERKMFGGLAFMVRGHMTVVASGRGGLMVRTDPAQTEELLSTTRAELIDMGGRQMRGWLRVDSAHIDSDDELTAWINRALTYTATLSRSKK